MADEQPCGHCGTSVRRGAPGVCSGVRYGVLGALFCSTECRTQWAGSQPWYRADLMDRSQPGQGR